AIEYGLAVALIATSLREHSLHRLRLTSRSQDLRCDAPPRKVRVRHSLDRWGINPKRARSESGIVSVTLATRGAYGRTGMQLGTTWPRRESRRPAVSQSA